MKRALISLLERMRADLNDAIAAVERGDVDEALAKLRDVNARIREHVAEAP